MLLEGIFVPLTTPFRGNGRVFLRKLEANVARYSLTPAAGMLVLGSAGEPDELSDEERVEVLKAAMAAAGAEKVMIAGISGGGVRNALREAEGAAAAGYDALAVRGPEFASERLMRAELITHFSAIADGAALPLIVVSEGLRRIGEEAMAELAGHPQVIGVMNDELTAGKVAELKRRTAEVSREVTVTTVFASATGRMVRGSVGDGLVTVEGLRGGGAAVAAIGVKTRKKRVGFQVLAGQVGGMLEAWQAGATGAVPRLAACAAQGCCEVWQAYRDGDMALAEEKQARVRKIGAKMEGWAGIAALKYGCEWNGYAGGRPRLPLLGLTAEQERQIEAGLEGLRT